MTVATGHSFDKCLLNVHYIQGPALNLGRVEKEKDQEPRLRELSGEGRWKASDSEL